MSSQLTPLRAGLAKKLRFVGWTIAALAQRHRKLIIFGFIGGLIIFIALLQIIPLISAQMQKEYVVTGVVGTYTPSNLPKNIQELISMGLTQIDTDGKVLPALASEWSVSEDGKTYVFKLLANLYWHDGKNFTAYDVNYNLKDVTFTPLDDTTLEIKLKEVFTPLPNFLAKPLFRKGLIGLGPYKIGKIHLKGEYVNYIRLVPLSDQLPESEIKFYQSDSVAKTAFKLGEVNRLEEIIDATPFTQWNSTQLIETVKYNQLVGVYFNTHDELLKTKEIRQALSIAIEKPEKNHTATPLSTESWAYTNRVKQYEKDTEVAKKMIGDSFKDKTLTLSTFSQYLSLAQTIASSWEAIGVVTKVKVEDGMPEEFQALLATQEIPTDPDQYTLWHSTQKDTNITGYENPKIDKLLEDGRKEQDSEKRKVIYADFQKYLVEDAPAVFLFHPTTYTIVRK